MIACASFTSLTPGYLSAPASTAIEQEISAEPHYHRPWNCYEWDSWPHNASWILRFVSSIIILFPNASSNINDTFYEIYMPNPSQFSLVHYTLEYSTLSYYCHYTTSYTVKVNPCLAVCYNKHIRKWPTSSALTRIKMSKHLKTRMH